MVSPSSVRVLRRIPDACQDQRPTSVASEVAGPEETNLDKRELMFGITLRTARFGLYGARGLFGFKKTVSASNRHVI
jgi:hypothetical protein